MKPARRTKGRRPRARSTSRHQMAVWAAIRAVQAWTTREISDRTSVPLSTVQHYAVELERGGFVRRAGKTEATQTGGESVVWRTHWRCRSIDAAPLVTWATRTARKQGEPTP